MHHELAKQLHFYSLDRYLESMRFDFSRKNCIRILLLTILMVVAAIALAEVWIKADSNSSLFTAAENLPKRKVGLVLGCAQNIYFHHRVNAACELYNAGKIDYLLVSGDNHVATYNEAEAMKAALIKRGIPEKRIVCDYAGFSTIDSIVRAKTVFGQRKITIISQKFHVRRALFIAKRKKIDAIGYCAPDVELSFGARTQLREALARVKTVLDLYLLHRQPRFLGEPIHIGQDDLMVVAFPFDKA